MPHFLTGLCRLTRRFLIPLLIVACGLPVRAKADELAPSPPSASTLGVLSRTFSDPERTNWAGTAPRPIRVTVWYPSDGGGTREFSDNDGQRVELRCNSRVAPTHATFPLVLISHGSGGNAGQMFWLGQFLAQHGYIAAALDHNGTEEEELHRKRPTLTDFFGWERARDISVVLTRLLVDPELAGKIDPTRIGAAGFSLGATTALWTAGARLDLEELRRNSPPPPPPIADSIDQLIAFSKTNPVALASVARANRSYRDDRIKAVFALAPPMGGGFTEEGLRDVRVPACIVVGDADPIAPADANAKHFARYIPTARLVVVPGERGHYLQPITPERRRAELREVADMARQFFDQQLH